MLILQFNALRRIGLPGRPKQAFEAGSCSGFPKIAGVTIMISEIVIPIPKTHSAGANLRPKATNVAKNTTKASKTKRILPRVLWVDLVFFNLSLHALLF